MSKVKSRLALMLAVILIAGSLQVPVFAVRRGGAGIPAGASVEAGVEDSGQVTETEPMDLVPDSAGTGGTEPQDEKKVESITLNQSELTMIVGATAELSATVLPEDADDRSLTWRSGNPGVAAVDEDGTVTAVAKGETVIEAAANDGSKVVAECSITVRQPVTSVTLNKTSLTLKVGKTETLTATAGPSDADNKTVKWTTSNSAVATVSSTGVVKGIKRGTVTITATAADGSGKKATCKVTIK